jgi:hypothetical protein
MLQELYTQSKLTNIDECTLRKQAEQGEERTSQKLKNPRNGRAVFLALYH